MNEQLPVIEEFIKEMLEIVIPRAQEKGLTRYEAAEGLSVVLTALLGSVIPPENRNSFENSSDKLALFLKKKYHSKLKQLENPIITEMLGATKFASDFIVYSNNFIRKIEEKNRATTSPFPLP